MFDAYAGQTISAPGSTFRKFVEHIYAQDMKRLASSGNLQYSQQGGRSYGYALATASSRTPSISQRQMCGFAFSAVEQYCAEGNIMIYASARCMGDSPSNILGEPQVTFGYDMDGGRPRVDKMVGMLINTFCGDCRGRQSLSLIY